MTRGDPSLQIASGCSARSSVTFIRSAPLRTAPVLDFRGGAKLSMRTATASALPVVDAQIDASSHPSSRFARRLLWRCFIGPYLLLRIVDARRTPLASHVPSAVAADRPHFHGLHGHFPATRRCRGNASLPGIERLPRARGGGTPAPCRRRRVQPR